jgi:acetone carboxylase gamma subunit
MVTARHDSSRDSVTCKATDEGLVSEGRLKRMQRERGVAPTVGKKKQPAWKYLTRLLKPYCEEKTIAMLLVLLSDIQETDIGAIQRILALSDELRPNVKDIVLIYETFVQSDKSSKSGFPGDYSSNEKLDAMDYIRSRNEALRPMRPARSIPIPNVEVRRVGDGYTYSYKVQTTDNTRDD